MSLATRGDTIAYTGAVTADVPSPVPVAVPQFDPAQGTLTSVTLSLVDASMTADLLLFNKQAEEELWTVTLEHPLIQFAGGGASTTIVWDNVPGPDIGYTSQFVVGPAGTTIVSPSTPAGSSANTFGALAAFIGTGTVADMTIDLSGDWGATGLGRGDTFGVDTFSGTATWMVTYGFVAIPESSPLSLLLLGGTLALAARRRGAASPGAR